MAQANTILSKKSLEEKEDLLTCAICREVYTNPKQLTCVHSFCKHCLDGMTNDASSSLRCPVCRRECDIQDGGISALKDNEYLRNLSDVYKAKKEEDANQPLECSICKESKHPEHISHCLECDNNLCKKCEEYHSKFLMLSGHTVVTFKELLCGDGILNRSKASCKEHTNRMIELFCFNCQICMCLACLNPHLKKNETNCDIITLPIDREVLMGTWKNQVHHLENIIKIYEEKLTYATRVQQNIRESTEKAREEIQAESERLIAVIQENTKTLLRRLDEESKVEEKLAALHRDKAEATIEACKHLLKMREHVATYGKDVEVIPAMILLEKQLEYLKKPVDYLNIEGMFRFTSNDSLEVGTLHRIKINDSQVSWDKFNKLKRGDKVRRGTSWKCRGDDYQYRTGTIVQKYTEPETVGLFAGNSTGFGSISHGFSFGSATTIPQVQTRISNYLEVSWGEEYPEQMRFPFSETKSGEVACQIIPGFKKWCEI